MALSSGREEFAVAFVGKDEVSAMITELQAKLKGLEGQAKAAGSAGASAAGAGGIKGLGESLKSATSGATSLGGGLAGLRMGMLGIPTAIGGMVAGVVAFASAIKDAFVRDPIKEFHDEFKRDFAAMEAAADKLIARLRDAKGLLKDATTKELSAKGELENVIAAADALLGPLKKQNEFLEQQTKAWLDQKDVLAGMNVVFRGMVAPLNQQRELQNEIKRISDERFAAQEKLNELLSAQNASLATTVALEAAAARERSKQSILTKIQADTAAPMGVLAALGAKYGGKKPTGGGGGSLSDTEKLRRALLSGNQAAIDKAFGGQGEGIKLGELSDMGRGGFGAEDIDKANDLAKLELEALKRADATWEELSFVWAQEEDRAARRGPVDSVVALTQALGELAGVAPEVSSAFAEIGQVFAATGEAGGDMGDAVVASIGPMGKLAAGFIKGEREKALVRGLAETAESIASFASGNIPGGVGHAAAAAAFFGVAGKGGGGQRGIAGGGREGAAAGTRAGAANDNEPRTVVYISAGVMDGQSVQRAIVRAESSARGTGWEARRGW